MGFLDDWAREMRRIDDLQRKCEAFGTGGISGLLRETELQNTLPGSVRDILRQQQVSPAQPAMAQASQSRSPVQRPEVSQANVSRLGSESKQQSEQFVRTDDALQKHSSTHSAFLHAIESKKMRPKYALDILRQCFTSEPDNIVYLKQFLQLTHDVRHDKIAPPEGVWESVHNAALKALTNESPTNQLAAARDIIIDAFSSKYGPPRQFPHEHEDKQSLGLPSELLLVLSVTLASDGYWESAAECLRWGLRQPVARDFCFLPLSARNAKVWVPQAYERLGSEKLFALLAEVRQAVTDGQEPCPSDNKYFHLEWSHVVTNASAVACYHLYAEAERAKQAMHASESAYEFPSVEKLGQHFVLPECYGGIDASDACITAMRAYLVGIPLWFMHLKRVPALVQRAKSQAEQKRKMGAFRIPAEDLRQRRLFAEGYNEGKLILEQLSEAPSVKIDVLEMALEKLVGSLTWGFAKLTEAERVDKLRRKPEELVAGFKKITWYIDERTGGRFEGLIGQKGCKEVRVFDLLPTTLGQQICASKDPAAFVFGVWDAVAKVVLPAMELMKEAGSVVSRQCLRSFVLECDRLACDNGISNARNKIDAQHLKEARDSLRSVRRIPLLRHHKRTQSFTTPAYWPPKGIPLSREVPTLTVKEQAVFISKATELDVVWERFSESCKAAKVPSSWMDLGAPEGSDEDGSQASESVRELLLGVLVYAVVADGQLRSSEVEVVEKALIEAGDIRERSTIRKEVVERCKSGHAQGKRKMCDAICEKATPLRKHPYWATLCSKILEYSKQCLNADGEETSDEQQAIDYLQMRLLAE